MARAADRERVLLEMKWIAEGGGAEINEIGQGFREMKNEFCVEEYIVFRIRTSRFDPIQRKFRDMWRGF